VDEEKFKKGILENTKSGGSPYGLDKKKIILKPIHLKFLK
jgi:hypothetical protein